MAKRGFFWLLFLSLTIFLPPTLSAADNRAEYETFTKLLMELQEQLSSQDRTDNLSHDDRFSRACVYPREDVFEAEIIREQRDLMARDKGLELRGGLSSGNLSSSEDDDTDSKTGRGNIELSWDILKNGYLENDAKAERLDLLVRETELRSAQRELKRHYRCQYLEMEKEFSGLRLQTLALKLKLLEPVYRVERRAYFKQWSFLDDYLVSEQDLVLTRQELDSLHADPYYDLDMRRASLPPIITVDLPGLLESVRNDASLAALYDIQKMRLKNEDTVFRDSLRLYLRKDFAAEDGLGEDDDLVAGLRFRVPLHARKTNLLDLKLKKLEREKQYAQWQRIALCRSSHRELQEQLRRSIRQFYRHERAEERLRRTLFALNGGEQELLTVAITRMKTLLDARLELINAQEELYRRVSRLFEAARVPYRSDLVSSVLPEPGSNRARMGNRSLYIWSKDFNRLDNADIMAFLEAKQITTVLLSDGRGVPPGKRDAFLEMLAKRRIKAELIIGDNSWIFKRKHKRAVEKTLVAAEQTGRIHFDIEPQAMDGYRTNKADYIRLYLDLIRKTSKNLLGRQFTIAVPFHWPGTVYRELADSADRLFVMAYGSDDPDIVLRRLAPALEAVGPEKLAVALRPEDFQDEWAMEKMIERIQFETGIDTFGIHDIGHFLNLSAIPDEAEN